jgi:septum formation topological specificity factor MinE
MDIHNQKEMTPMTNASTPSVAVVSEGQARKLADQLTPGLVEAIVEGNLPHDRFQLILQQEKNLKVRSRFVQFLRDILAEIIDMVAIHVNYSEENAIAKAIEDGHFNDKYLDLKPEEIPLIGSGEADHEVGELHLNEYLTTRDVMVKVDEQGFKFADPLTALRYAVKLPERQRQYPLAILFEAAGRLWFLILDRNADERGLIVYRCYLDRGWGGRYRFLVVRK